MVDDSRSFLVTKAHRYCTLASEACNYIIHFLPGIFPKLLLPNPSIFIMLLEASTTNGNRYNQTIVIALYKKHSMLLFFRFMINAFPTCLVNLRCGDPISVDGSSKFRALEQQWETLVRTHHSDHTISGMFAGYIISLKCNLYKAVPDNLYLISKLTRLFPVISSPAGIK